jgi:NAD(P)-dependent dehydrogenase (short-subunit alcohol dehydrogenase family)
MNQPNNQVAIITGSSRGFGYAMAVEFARAGARVVVSSRDADAVKRAVDSLPNPVNALGVVCDVRDLAQVYALADAAVQKFGQIDIWINNAGLSHPYTKMVEVKPEHWHTSFDTNFYGTYHGCRVALEKMLPRGRGHIINVLGMGADRPAPNQSGYGASKAAVARLTQTLAQEYAGTGVSINAVLPGMMWTDMLFNAEVMENP